MDDSTRSLLVQRIENEFNNLDDMEDNESKQKAINNIVALYKLKIEEDKLDTEYSEHRDKLELEKEQQKFENDLKKQDMELKSRQIDGDLEAKSNELELNKVQLEERKLDRWVDLGAQVGLTLIGVIAYDIWFRKGLKFEETGTITSPMTRNLFSKMLPKR